MLMRHIKFFCTLFFGLLVFGSCKKEECPEPTDPNASLKDGLVAYYPFNGNVLDESGNNLNGTVVGNVTHSDNRYFESGKSILLDGVTSYIKVQDNEKLQLKKAMTIYLEFLSTSENTACLVGKRNISNGFQAFNLAINYQSPVVFDVIKKDHCNASNVSSDWSYCRSEMNSTIMLNCWNYVAAIFDGTSQKVYLNGNLVANQTVDFGEMGGCSPTDLRIGYWWDSDPIPFKGKIDEVRIYNRVLTENEIKQLYKL